MLSGQQSKKTNFQEWQMKRISTTRAFTLECVMLGMEYSVTFLTLWLYLNTLVKTDHPQLFYSLISASYLLAAVLFSVIIGRWVDRTRKIRQTFIICNTLVIIGNILYALPFSPWLLVAGRLICGAGGPLRSIISGEIARCYPDTEVLSKFSSMGMAFAMGFIMGPGLNFAFKDVDVTIGMCRVTYVNVPGIYMAVLFILTQIYVIMNVFDLSKEYDLKAEEILNDIPPIITEYHVTSSERIPRKLSTRSLNGKSLSKKLRLNSFYSQSVNLTHLTTDNSPCHISVTLDSSHNNSTQSLFLPSIKRDINHIEASLKSYQGSLATARLQQPGLIAQTFTRSDSMISTSMLLFIQSQSHNNEEEIPLLYPNTKSEDENEMTSVIEILSQIIHNVDVMLVLLLTFFMCYWMVAFDMWLPIMVIDVMGMGITELNGIVFGFGCISAFILLTLSFKVFTDETLFKLSLFCMLALALMEFIFGTMKFYHSNLYGNIALWALWGILFAIVVIMDEVFLIGVMVKMTSSKIQTFIESLRLAMARLGALTALLTSTFLFEWVEYVCIVGIIFSVVAFVILLLRRKTFINPKIVIR